MTERIHCARCRMSFRVVLPHNTGAAPTASWTRCSEPNCGRHFWHAQRDKGGPVICGVAPIEHPRHADVVVGAPCTGDSLPELTPAPGLVPQTDREPAAFSRGGVG